MGSSKLDIYRDFSKELSRLQEVFNVFEKTGKTADAIRVKNQIKKIQDDFYSILLDEITDIEVKEKKGRAMYKVKGKWLYRDDLIIELRQERIQVAEPSKFKKVEAEEEKAEEKAEAEAAEDKEAKAARKEEEGEDDEAIDIGPKKK